METISEPALIFCLLFVTLMIHLPASALHIKVTPGNQITTQDTRNLLCQGTNEPASSAIQTSIRLDKVCFWIVIFYYQIHRGVCQGLGWKNSFRKTYSQLAVLQLSLCARGWQYQTYTTRFKQMLGTDKRKRTNSEHLFGAQSINSCHVTLCTYPVVPKSCAAAIL